MSTFCRCKYGHLDIIQNTGKMAADSQTKPADWAVSTSVCCYHLHPPLPFMITQSRSRCSLYCPTRVRRLSLPSLLCCMQRRTFVRRADVHTCVWHGRHTAASTPAIVLITLTLCILWIQRRPPALQARTLVVSAACSSFICSFCNRACVDWNNFNGLLEN